MSDFFENSIYFGLTLTFVAYGIGSVLKSKLRHAAFNPILISMLLCIGALAAADVPY